VRRWLLVVLWLGCRYVLAAVFLMAAVSKLADMRGFSDQLVLRSGLPYAWSTKVAVVLPWLELTCGLCLTFGRAVREAALLLSMLLAALLVYALTHLGQSDCRCFLFPGREPQWTWWMPVRNAVLLLCALYVWWPPRTDKRET
jgi:putative oxidoreductase